MKILLGAILGAFGSYGVGVFVGMCIECTPLFRVDPSNLCGLIALFYYGPIAALFGLVTGVVVGLRRSKTQ